MKTWEKVFLLTREQIPAVGLGIDRPNPCTAILDVEFPKGSFVETEPSLPHGQHSKPTPEHQGRHEHGSAGSDHGNVEHRPQSGRSGVADGVDAHRVVSLVGGMHPGFEQGHICEDVVHGRHVVGGSRLCGAVVELDSLRELGLVCLLFSLRQLV